MRIAILTNEYPPHIYGGAGVHVHFLSKELAAMDGGRHLLKVLCFGEQKESESNLTVQGMKVDFTFPFQEPRNMRLLETILRNVPHDRHSRRWTLFTATPGIRTWQAVSSNSS